MNLKHIAATTLSVVAAVVLGYKAGQIEGRSQGWIERMRREAWEKDSKERVRE